jgi:hypothetical protein
MFKRITKLAMATTLIAAVLCATLVTLPIVADARGGGGGGGRGGGGGGGFEGGGRSAPTSINRGGGDFNSRNTNVDMNRNVDVNRNANVNVDNRYNDYHGGGYYGGDYHPVAAGVAVGVAAGVTAAAIGSLAYSLPSGCAPYAYGGPYYQCGSVWYQPQYQGSNVTYVVVDPPQ